MADVLLLEGYPEVPVDANQIAKLTKPDPTLFRVMRWIRHGCPDQSPADDFKPYFTRRGGRSAHRDYVLWGSCVVIVPPARAGILQHLHSEHPGTVQIKRFARGYVWWRGLESNIK